MAFTDTLKNKLAPAAILTGSVLALNWVLSLLKYPAAPLYSSIQPVSAVTPTVGTQFLQWLGGIIPVGGSFLTSAIVILFISAYLILLVGSLLIDYLKLPVANGKVGRIVSEILYGSLVFYLLIVGPVLKAWGVLIGLAIHTIIAAYIAAYVSDWLNVKM